MTRIEIACDTHDAVVGSEPVTWSVGQLRTAYRQRGLVASVVGPERVDASIRVMSADDPAARSSMAAARVAIPEAPGSFAIGARPNQTLLCAADVRGLVYATLELADRVTYAGDPTEAIPVDPIVARPSNAVRSVMRLFCSEDADLAWFRDEAFWERYLTMLVGQRFDRFSLTLGLGYNYPRGVTDAYLCFPYPFLFAVPGYDVRVPQLPDEERDRNLEALTMISEHAVARGLDFQLGLWTHAFEWIESPDARHTIEGLTSDLHASYCRDAVELLLERCPAITGLTFRIHGESGVPERSWDFWRTVFSGVAAAGRPVRLDLHAKGLDEVTLRDALDTGLPVTVSPKFWAEHMGLPYHQAAIRELERAVREDPSSRSDWHRAMVVSEGSRPFTRYGYADFLREERDYDIVFRLWPGTQRLLLWGDPATAAAYGRVSSIGGASGLEWFEPLSFVGREGTGTEGSRTGYADASITPRWDWEKYAYTYRLFGRLLYDPDAAPDGWRRWLQASFGEAARDAEEALASASRLLPLVTTAHHPSASNNYYWPELYTDMPIVWSGSGTRPHEYHDTPAPRRFGTVSPLDPETFSTVRESVLERLAGASSGRVSSLEVAARLDALAGDATDGLRRFTSSIGEPNVEARRWTVDIALTAALGRFFAAKLRAAYWYELEVESGDPDALRRAVEAYRAARQAWVDAIGHAGDVYADDLAHGPQAWLRGHWSDRLPAIEADLADMEERLASRSDDPRLGGADPIELPRQSGAGGISHVCPSGFRPGAPLELAVAVGGDLAGTVERITVRYRPMDQSVTMFEREMDRTPAGYACTIPGEETSTPYPLAYAFVVHPAPGEAWRYPGLGPRLVEQPYFILYRDREETG